jgi:hypothetical protein
VIDGGEGGCKVSDDAAGGKGKEKQVPHKVGEEGDQAGMPSACSCKDSRDTSD